MAIPGRRRSLVGGSYFAVGGGFMLWVATSASTDEALVEGILLTAGLGLVVLGLMEIVTGWRRHRDET
jgi:formate/nitrite transporter FocA (FNT family)